MEVINTQQFNEMVKEGNLFVDFFATWCGPCKMLAPELEDLQNGLKDKVKVVKVDVDQSPDLAQQFGIMSVPTMILFKDGQKIAAFSGYQKAQALQVQIEAKL